MKNLKYLAGLFFALILALPASADYKDVITEDFKTLQESLPLDCGDGIICTKARFSPALNGFYFTYKFTDMELPQMIAPETIKTLHKDMLPSMKELVRGYGNEVFEGLKKAKTRVHIEFINPAGKVRGWVDYTAQELYY